MTGPRDTIATGHGHPAQSRWGAMHARLMMWLRGLAPKTRTDFALKCVLFVAGFLSLRLVIAVLVDGTSAELVKDGLITLAIATPTAIILLAMGGHSYRLEEQLAQLAVTDMLTGLPNRRGFLEKAEGTDHGVLMVMDVDHFKRVNDTYGHAVGDICLKVIAGMLRHTVRDTDILGRLGGEEFGVLLVGADLDIARRIGTDLAGGTAFEIEYQANRRLREHITTSLGAVAVAPRTDVSALLDLADKALYRAKADGRARLVVHDPAPAATRT